MTPSKKQLKRDYAAARRHFLDLDTALEGLLGTQVYLPPGILAPAIDLMFDKVEAAKKPYWDASVACRERGIKRIEGIAVPAWSYVGDLDKEESDDDGEDES